MKSKALILKGHLEVLWFAGVSAVVRYLLARIDFPQRKQTQVRLPLVNNLLHPTVWTPVVVVHPSAEGFVLV